ncbi:hypothetical protein CGCS363_v011310 [Colletotrichum siamense]|uniref:uncharacterized protein n=1 Tax=Colletotrichum siamense TaxID=690259 RepID=UPI001872819C|nr:uncharacterized protein CGCS363_v011310 [Colletotrichum siamense]KAF5492671.1 hypothetical protein CGCS363_v011310 [Colletotrichum siamense]
MRIVSYSINTSPVPHLSPRPWRAETWHKIGKTKPRNTLTAGKPLGKSSVQVGSERLE